MSERLCGYCRQSGHRRPDCPEFNGQRSTILTHTPQQRKVLIESLGKIGLGIGAMIKISSSYDGERIALIKDYDWVRYCNFIDSKSLRYSKKVKLEQRFVDRDFTYRAISVGILSMGNGFAEERSMRVHITHELRKANNERTDDSEWMQDRWLNIVAPSYDIDYDPKILVEKVDMPSRLILKGESLLGVTGIMPTGIIY